MEEIVLSLIMHSREARIRCMEAIHLAKIGDFESARKFLEKADEELGYAHNIQTSLIQSEAECKQNEFSLLLIHGEDHLMTAMTLRDLVTEIIDIYKKLILYQNKNVTNNI